MTDVISWICGAHDTSFLDILMESQRGEFDDVQVESYKKLVSGLPFAAYTIIGQCMARPTPTSSPLRTSATCVLTPATRAALLSPASCSAS